MRIALHSGRLRRDLVEVKKASCGGIRTHQLRRRGMLHYNTHAHVNGGLKSPKDQSNSISGFAGAANSGSICQTDRATALCETRASRVAYRRQPLSMIVSPPL